MELKIQSGDTTAVIDTYGGKLVSLISGGREYIWRETYCYWPDRAGVLFPTCGRLYGGGITYRGKRYDMPLHGFAYTSEFGVEKHSPHSLTLTLRNSPETLRVYPFEFVLRVTYALSGSRLDVTANAENVGGEDMYCSIGFHPWLKVPFSDGVDYEECRVAFPLAVDACHCVMSGGVLDTLSRESCLQDGELRLKHSLFDNDAYMLSGTGGKAVIECGEDSVALSYGGMPYIGFWHMERTNADLLCIEPMTALPGREGVTEDWQTRPDVTLVPPGGSATATVSIETGIK